MSDITKIIEGIFTLANFWLPGCIFLLSFQKLIGAKTDSSLYTNVFAVVISYLLRVCAELIPALRGTALSAQPYTVCAFYCLAGLILALLLGLLYRSKKLGDGFASIFVKSLHNDMWSDVIDFHEGTLLHIVLKNGNRVFGGFHSVEEKGNDSWLALDNYFVTGKDGGELTSAEARRGDPAYQDEPLLVLRVADIERYEVEYIPREKPKKLKARDQQEL